MASVSKREWEYKGAMKSAWIVRYVDAGGIHRQKTFSTKKQADAYRSKVEVDTSKGVHFAAADRMTVAELADEFMCRLDERALEGAIGNGHVKRLSIFVRLHILPHLGGHVIGKISLSMLEAWYRRLRSDAGLSLRSSRQAVQTLKMMLDHAIKREWLHRNVATLLLTEKRGAEIAPIRVPSLDEAKAILTAVNAPMWRGRTADAALRLRCVVHLAMFCGLRIGEIFGLVADNINYVDKVVYIRNSLSRFDGLKGPKTVAGTRDVALPDHIAEMLLEYHRLYFVKSERNKARLLFTYRDGAPFNQDGFRQGSWGPLLRRAGLSEVSNKPSFHIHALRHFATSWMVENGWSIPDVVSALGHSKPDMTLGIYAHSLRRKASDQGQMQALADRLIDVKPSEIAQNMRMIELNN